MSKDQQSDIGLGPINEECTAIGFNAFGSTAGRGMARPHGIVTFEDYNVFVKGMKKYPEKHAIVYPTLGMMGEAGEASEKVKKWLRGDTELDKDELIKEVGDVLWYLTSLADDLGYTLQNVVDANVKKLSSRKERGVLHGSGDNR